MTFKVKYVLHYESNILFKNWVVDSQNFVIHSNAGVTKETNMVWALVRKKDPIIFGRNFKFPAIVHMPAAAAEG